jgi:prepilin-type N-terminal cleavage/methylation domain-containing protein
LARLRQITRSEAGFTLMELMVVMVLGGILVTLGAFAVRQFWHVRSLSGAQDTIVTQLRQTQQRAFAESHPNVYGVAVLPGQSDFALVKGTATTNACVVVNRQKLGDGVVFGPLTNLVPVTSATTLRTNCRTALGNNTYQIVFFYARGTASVTSVAAEQKIELSQPAINRTNAIQVSPLTGRVTRI